MGQGQAAAQAVAGTGYNGQAPQQQYQQQQFGQAMQSPVSPGFAPVSPSHSQSNWSPPQSMHPLPLPPVHPQRLPSPQPMQMPIPAPHQPPVQQPVPLQQPQPVQLQPGPEQVPILAAEPPALPPPPPYTETVSDAFSVNVPATPTSPHQSLHSVHVSPPRPTPTFVVHNADPGMSPAPVPGGSEKYEYRPEKYTYTPNRGMDGDVGPRSRAMDMGMEAGPSSAGPSNWAGPSSWSA
ncbi:uncharacterized protein EHS24_003149 [Apiotrichum porosum]|uniref:Uncharacterized protein n=1 Tax=Apiotrichum porosum TaxID=105984 RepID=A0A427XFC0_9TREE|nr:uncharacterized protein EHS24_003149 [Apiotrichum porosum]RSH77589.1 hypothetical protein EHS24_003149 [Apiotrichum porosum]